MRDIGPSDIDLPDTRPWDITEVMIQIVLDEEKGRS
jgi:hypothetical protein